MRGPPSALAELMMGLVMNMMMMTMLKRGDVSMVQMKKSKDGNSGYAFIKFCNKEEERTIMRQHHQIDGRECRFILRSNEKQVIDCSYY